MTRAGIAIACLAVVWTPAFGLLAAGPEDAAEAFRAANDLYARGEYEDAADRYRLLLEEGHEAAAIHFNLGNAYYKLHRIGPAILAYERAARLDPRDADIAGNLRFLRTLTADKPAADPDASTEVFLQRALAITTPDQDAAIFTVIWLIAGAFGAGAILLGPGRPRRVLIWGIAVLLFPLILAGGTLLMKVWRSAGVVEGIVLADRIDVRSGPGEDHTSLFAIHEGIKVRVRGEQGKWTWISLDSGLNGWIPNTSFDPI